MPTPKNYSFIAIAVSAALASMVFPPRRPGLTLIVCHPVGWSVSCRRNYRLLFPLRPVPVSPRSGPCPTTFISGTPAPSRFMAMASRLMGRARRRLNTLSRLFKTAGRKSGRDFWQRPDHSTQSANAANNGRDVDGIRTTARILRITRYLLLPVTVPASTWMVRMVTVLTPDITHWARVGPDRPIFTSATIRISKRPVARTWHYSQRHAGCVTCQNTIVVGNRAYIVTTGDSSEGLRTGQRFVDSSG